MLLTLSLTSPVGMLMEWIWMGQGLSAGEICCVVVVLTGVGITLWPDARVPLPGRNLCIGGAFALLAAVGGALGAVLSRRAYDIGRANQEMIDGPTAAFQRVLGGLIVTAMIFGVLRLGRTVRQQSGAPVPEKWRRLMPWVAANALAGLTIGVSFMQRALEDTQAGIVLAIVAITPIAVIPLARIVEGEGISFRALAGAVIAVAGAAGLALVHYG
jgi:drug/metabolite transporter (DMT)-like permease